MKLNKVEKVIVVIIVLGLILGLGIFMLVKPSFEDIGKQQKVLDSYKTELNDLNAKLARLDTIDADIDEQKTLAKKYETKFYPDLTTYEASEIAMAYLQAANLEAHTINITPLSTVQLSLSYFAPPEVEYALKSYGSAAKDPETEEQVLEEGQFKDGNKIYTLTLDSAAKVTITDENGEEVQKSRYTENMKKVYKAAICRYVASNSVSQTTGVITATYEVKGKYVDYINFIDHIYSLERATTVPSVIIPMTYTPKTEEDDEDTTYIDEAGYAHTSEEVSQMSDVVLPIEDDTEVVQTITLNFITVEPMKALKNVDADGTTIVVDQRPAVY